MKKNLLLVLMALSMGTGAALNAQNIEINVQVEAPACRVHRPVWLGTVAWDAPYVYIPELNLYYSMAEGFYYYLCDGRWCCSVSLPAIYRAYNLAKLRHIAIRTSRPWRYNSRHRARYCRVEHPHARPPRPEPRPHRARPARPQRVDPPRGATHNRPGVKPHKERVSKEFNRSESRQSTEGRKASERRFVNKGLRRVSTDGSVSERTTSSLRSF